MYQLFKYTVIGLVAGSTLLLSGCWVEGGISCQLGKTCDHPMIGVHGGTGKNPGGGGGPPIIKNIQKPLVTALTVNPSDIHINVAGTDYDVGSVGMASITLRDSSSAIIASRAFTWVRSGNDLVFQSPSAVQNWVSSYPNAVNANANVDVGTIPADHVSHTLSEAVYYGGQKQTSASRSFPAYCKTNGRWRRKAVTICPY